MTSVPVPSSTAAPARRPSRATVAGIAAAAGLVPLNSTMIAVALPAIARDLDVSTGRVSLLVTVYLAAMLVGQPVAGRIADRIGSRRTVTAALAGIGACSVAAALAGSLAVLVAARLGQAVFAAALGPSVQSMLRAVSPAADRGRNFGILGSVIGVAAAGGPILGGALTQLSGWQAVFVVNIPLAAVALVLSSRAGRAGDGGAAPEVAASAPAPDLADAGRLLANRVFVACYSAQALSTVAQYALLLLPPVLLSARGWRAGSVGLVLSALTVGMIVTGPVGGRAGDRWGRRAPVVAGLAAATVAVAVLTLGGPGIAPVVLVAALAAYGTGLGFATPSLMTAGLESVREERTGAAAGVLSTARYVGSTATSIAVALLVSDDGGGTRTVLALSLAAMVAASIVGRRLPGPSLAGATLARRPGS